MMIYNATMKINHLEMLKANIGLELISVHDKLDRFMGRILKGRTEAELARQAGILGKTIRDNNKLANSIVNASFHNANFSQRVWANQSLLQSRLNQLLQRGLIQGKNPREMARELQKTFNSSVYDSERLMRTELARVQTDAQLKSLKENSFALYEFIANSGCCEACQSLNGKHFKVKKAMPGENVPPVHPNCRCAVSAYEDSEEYEAWLDFLDKGGTTAEWEKKKKVVISSSVIAKSGKNGKIKESESEKTLTDSVFEAIGINKSGSLSISDAVSGSNPNYERGTAYSINCQRCVQAYEFRRRGYDVTAKPKPQKGNTVIWGSECFIKSGEDAYSAYTMQMTEADVKKVLKNSHDGSRYSIYVSWKGRNAGAHVFIAEKENGIVRYVDPQTGNNDVSHYFSNGKRGDFGIFRLDDKDITTNVEIIKSTVKGAI